MKNKANIHKIFKKASNCKKITDCYGRNIKIFVPRPDEGFGRKKVDILFINERPGPKTRETGLVSPCNDDPTAKRFRNLIEPLKIPKKKYFSTNACLCLPNKDCVKNKAPSAKQVRNCSKQWLKKQIEILAPKLIVPLGNWGRKALCYCLEESETLEKLKKFRLRRDIGGDPFNFGSFIVYPLYHTSPKTLGRRSEDDKKKDWKKIREILDGRYKSQKN